MSAYFFLFKSPLRPIDLVTTDMAIVRLEAVIRWDLDELKCLANSVNLHQNSRSHRILAYTRAAYNHDNEIYTAMVVA